MFKTNEYFQGKVKSIGFEGKEGPATIGVMAPGAYEFGTSKKEFMTITSGILLVKLPGEKEFKEFKQNETFIIEANQKFQVKVKQDATYICFYK